MNVYFILTFLKEKSCPDLLSAPENGSKVCSDTDKVGSNCKFECDMYYTRVGSSNSTCIEVNGQVFWNNPVPVCQGTLLGSTCKSN